jgi:protein SCO1/2
VVAPAAPAQSGGGLAPAAPKRQVNANVGFDQKLDAQVPLDTPFRDEAGRRVTLKDCMLADKPVVLVLAYYRCPMLCTEVLNGLVEGMRKVPYTAGTDYTVLTVSIDPKEHHPIAAEKKKHYLREYGRADAERGWRFLTGEQRPIQELAAAVGFKYEYDKAFKEYDHPSGIVILTPSGKISRYLFGTDYTKPDGEARDLRLALVEAGEGKIGTFNDRNVWLRCYRFDHLSNGYAFNVLFVVRAGGVATVVLLAVTVTGFLVRERRRAARTAALTTGAAPPECEPAPADRPSGVSA